jgi:hypothetical protein
VARRMPLAHNTAVCDRTADSDSRAAARADGCRARVAVQSESAPERPLCLRSKQARGLGPVMIEVPGSNPAASKRSQATTRDSKRGRSAGGCAGRAGPIGQRWRPQAGPFRTRTRRRAKLEARPGPARGGGDGTAGAAERGQWLGGSAHVQGADRIGDGRQVAVRVRD